MSKVKDLTNMVFGRLSALRCVGLNKHRQAIWLCRCSCDGKEIEVVSGNLVQGLSQSCGCVMVEKRAAQQGENAWAFKHGQSKGPSYNSWHAMVYRCEDSKSKDWSNYGGANPPVLVCDRWLNSFEAFLEDIGERPEGTSLSRYLDTGDYKPGNVEWALDADQKAEAKGKKAMFALRTYHQSQLVAA